MSKLLIDHLPTALVILDDDSTCCYANKAALELLEQSLQDMIGKPFGYPLVFEQSATLQVHKGGGANATLLMQTVKTNWDGKPALMVTLSDVTQFSQTEQYLKRQNNYLSAVHGIALTLMNRLNIDEVLESIVQKAAFLLHTEHVFIALLAEDADDVLENKLGLGYFRDSVGVRIKIGDGAAGKVVQTGLPIAVDNYNTWEGRSEQFVDPSLRATAVVPFFSGDRVIGTLGVAYSEPWRTFNTEDVQLLSQFAQLASVALDSASLYTAARLEIVVREQIESRLRDSEKLLTSIYQTVPIGICMVDEAAQFVQVNDAFCSIFGYSRAELVGQTLLMLIPLDKRENAESLYLQDLDNATTQLVEWETRHKDGSRKIIELSAALLLNEEGKRYKIAGVKDITERKEQQQRLDRQSRLLKGVADSVHILLVSEDLPQAIGQALAILGESIQVEGIFILEEDLDFEKNIHILKHRFGWEHHSRPSLLFDKPDLQNMEYLGDPAGWGEKLVEGEIISGLTRNTPEFFCRLLSKPDVLSFVFVPVFAGKRFWGMMGFEDNHSERNWSEDEKSILKGAAGTFGTIMVQRQFEKKLIQAQDELKRWVGTLEQHNREIELMSKLNNYLEICNQPDEAYIIISEFAAMLFPDSSGCLCTSEEFDDNMHPVAVWGNDTKKMSPFPITDCWALRQNQAHFVDAALSQPAIQCKHFPYPGVDHFCMPVSIQRRYHEATQQLGVLTFWNNIEDNRMTESQRQLANDFSERISLALSNLYLRDMLRQQAIRDPLTNLFNRRFMFESLDREINRAERETKPICTLMLDLDYFKRINDTYGHAAGDIVLQKVSDLLNRSIRGSDIACRYGGEEFVLVLSEINLENALQRAEHIRQAIRKMQIQFMNQLLPVVTVSIGVSAYPQHGRTGDVLLRSADTACYQAKDRGRDQVVAAV